MNALLSALQLTFHNQCEAWVGWQRNPSCKNNNNCLPSIFYVSNSVRFTYIISFGLYNNTMSYLLYSPPFDK